MSINGTVKNGDLFIFYGLLKRGALGMPDTIDLDSAGEFLGNCRFRANLYSLGTFPGVVAGDMGAKASGKFNKLIASTQRSF